jgi:hypothetical protein
MLTLAGNRVRGMPTSYGDFSEMIKAYPAEALALFMFALAIGAIAMSVVEGKRIAGLKEENERLRGRLAEGGSKSEDAELFKQKRLMDKQRRPKS